MKQRTYVMVKPEFANNPEIIEEIKRRILNAGFKIVEESFIQYDMPHAKRHYKGLIEKFPELGVYITGDKAFGMVVEGENVIDTIHNEMAGKTKNPAPGTIRYDIPYMFGLPLRVTENVVHSSDSEETAEYEIEIFEELANMNQKEM